MSKFTELQKRHWQVYEKVRTQGMFNMFDPRARELTLLTKEEYLFVMKNYSELKAEVTNE